MLVLTVIMLVTVLVLLPLRIAASFRLDIDTKCLYTRATVFFLPVFKEKFAVFGRYLVCRGSVDANLDVYTLDGRSGLNLAKALVFDSVNVTFALDYTKTTPWTLPLLEGVCFAATSVFCGVSNCRLRTNTCFSRQNAIYGEIVVSVSLAEIFVALANAKRIKNSAKG